MSLNIESTDQFKKELFNIRNSFKIHPCSMKFYIVDKMQNAYEVDIVFEKGFNEKDFLHAVHNSFLRCDADPKTLIQSSIFLIQ